MAEKEMPQFRRHPAQKLLIAEIKETTHVIQKTGGEQYESTYFLTPTGELITKVMIVGTAIEKEDVGDDTPFWRIRVADPTGGIAVFAGKYQPEATQILAQLEIPCFVAVVGKLSIYQPESGNKIISIRPDCVTKISVDDRNSFLLDATEQLAARLKAPKNAERVKQVYPNWDRATLRKSAVEALRTMIEPAVEQPPQGQPPVEVPKVPEAPKAPEVPKVPEAPKKAEEKKAPEQAKPKEKPKEKPKKEEPKKAPEAATATITEVVLDIIIKQPKKECTYAKIFEVLKERGVGQMVDVDGAIKKLMSEGNIYEPKIGLLKAP